MRKYSAKIKTNKKLQKKTIHSDTNDYYNGNWNMTKHTKNNFTKNWKKIEIKYSLCQFCPISKKKKCEQSYTNQWEVKNLLDSWFCSWKKTPIESTMAVLKKSIGHWQVFSVWFRFILIFFSSWINQSLGHPDKASTRRKVICCSPWLLFHIYRQSA